MRAAGTQEFVARWRAVSAKNVDVAAGIIHGRSQVIKQVEQVGIEMTYLSRAMIAEIMIDLGQCLRQISFAAPIYDIEPLVGVGVIKTEPVFARRESGGFLRSPQRLD